MTWRKTRLPTHDFLNPHRLEYPNSLSWLGSASMTVIKIP